jgi:AcrR family transcriptional regulator
VKRVAKKLVKKQGPKPTPKQPVGDGRKRSFDLLWGTKARSSPGPKPALSLDGMVRAAIAVVDAEGLAALTMARIADELGVTPMALYRYVPGKDELVDLMIDKARGTPPPSSGRGWRTDLTEWARANFAVLQRHPWLVESVMSRVPIGPLWLAWVESAVRALSGSGLTGKEALSAVILVDGHVRSTAQISLGVVGTSEWAESFGRVLQAIRGDERYPALAAVVADGAFDTRPDDDDNAFAFGLERVLDGIDAFIRARRVRPGRKKAGRARP